MSTSTSGRLTAALLAVGLLSGSMWSATARATEIEPPAPLTEDLGDLEARVTLARWLGGDAPASAATLVTAAQPRTTDSEDALIVGLDGVPALRVGAPRHATLPALAMHVPEPERAGGGFEVLRWASDAAWAPSMPQLPIASASGGVTRFDVRPEDRNPIKLRTSVLDEISARVVRTPEPGTLALFALGLAGLAATTIARRRRRRDG